jgi:hypothetical protein
MSLFSTARSILEKNLQAVGPQAAVKRGEAFECERDTPAHIHWLVEESGLTAKAGLGFGSIGLKAIAQCLGALKYRVRSAVAVDQVGAIDV